MQKPNLFTHDKNEKISGSSEEIQDAYVNAEKTDGEGNVQISDEEKPSNQVTLKIPADLKKLTDVLLFIDDQLENIGCPLKTQMMIDIVVEELFVNIAHYAYRNGMGEAVISVQKHLDPAEIIIEFRDNGIPFNPLEKEDPDVTLSAEKRKIGGLGIFMVKKNVDDIKYRRENDQNILTIMKRL